MVKRLVYGLILIGQTCFAQDAHLAGKTIPWGASEYDYINFNQFKPRTTLGKINAYEAKEIISINGIEFVKTLNFVNNKGLSQVAYLADLNNEVYENKCSTIQNEMNKIYGQRTNEVHIHDQALNNYSEVIWTSKIDRIVRVFCYNHDNHNYVSVSIYPRWMVLDCSMHNAEEADKDRHIKRAFFYFDKANEDIRFFNNSNVTLPFNSTYQSQRIEFSHNENHDHTTIDLNSGVIMSKFMDAQGKEQLLVGTCKKQ